MKSDLLPIKSAPKTAAPAKSGPVVTPDVYLDRLVAEIAGARLVAASRAIGS